MRDENSNGVKKCPKYLISTTEGAPRMPKLGNGTQPKLHQRVCKRMIFCSVYGVGERETVKVETQMESRNVPKIAQSSY